MAQALTPEESAFWNGFLVTHGPIECQGRICPIHKPTDHHMRPWPLVWRSDTQLAERTCPHGIGHPDPDQYEYWDRTGTEYKGTHGCDGCCTPIEGG